MRSFIMAAVAAAGLTLATTSGVFAAPIAPIGKGADAIDSRAVAHYYGYGYRYHRHRHHRHCWWHHGHRHCRW
jgi:hypothetical protein